MLNINAEILSTWNKNNALYNWAATKIGVSYAEMMVLYALASIENPTQKQISENFGMQKQTVNSIVKNLKEKGYIKFLPSKKDKREKITVLTDEGKNYTKTIIAPLLEAENKALKAMGKANVQKMQETLEMYNLLLEKEIVRSINNER